MLRCVGPPPVTASVPRSRATCSRSWCARRRKSKVRRCARRPLAPSRAKGVGPTSLVREDLAVHNYRVFVEGAKVVKDVSASVRKQRAHGPSWQPRRLTSADARASSAQVVARDTELQTVLKQLPRFTQRCRRRRWAIVCSSAITVLYRAAAKSSLRLRRSSASGWPSIDLCSMCARLRRCAGRAGRGEGSGAAGRAL